MSNSEARNRLLLAAGSILFILILLLLAELFVRLFLPHVQLLGTEKHLLKDPAYGRTYGWVPGASGKSFSAPVAINNEGFRDHGGPADADSSILLIGDSVTFGVGVESDSTFAGRLQGAHPSIKVVNASAIGYSLEDYHEILPFVLERTRNIRHAFICYALNDFTPTLSRKQDVPPLWAARGLFREHSKFYVFLKGTLFDRSEDYFLYDYEFYSRESAELARTFSLLESLVDSLQKQHVPVTVILVPYEYQLRTDDPKYSLPQDKLRAFMHSRNIDYIDTEPLFRRDGSASKTYFLYADHMHLSSAGHAIVFTALESVLADAPRW